MTVKEEYNRRNVDDEHDDEPDGVAADPADSNENICHALQE